MRIRGTKILIFVSVCCLKFSLLHAQVFDLGIDAGSSGFFGDLGGANFKGRPFFFDLEGSLMKPAASLHFRYYVNSRLAVKAIFTYTAVAGADSLIQPTRDYAPEWYRKYRNLSFRSDIIEASVQAEVNIMKFIPGDPRSPFAPYAFGGIGVFHFNPTTVYKGQVVALQPLHTEGQGFPGTGVQPYSLVQPVFPLGVGIRYTVSRSVILGLEYSNHFTLTDYIDDVSKKYVSKEEFQNYFQSNPAMADLAYSLSVRSGEKDSTGVNSYITAPGEQRGDLKKDNYFIVQVSLSFIPGASGGHYHNKLNKYRRIQKRYLHG